ncbi:Neural cell adhesion molecule 2 [Sarcoptes scabiei]|uniref:Neural cell adhesion molecule 2 n=1 Tax=Sarcoptes scabiei TaxID=52283 RepID=A0A834R8S9_SARSC|nr:Neural cell adhesion molecule 2 [Sarcoptes scabiei]
MMSSMRTQSFLFSWLFLGWFGFGSAKVAIRPEPNGEVGMMSGQSKYFQCVGSNREKLSWIDPQGREISADPNNGIFVVKIRNTIKLELKNPTKQDSGQYKCIALNEQNQEVSSAFFQLRVFNPTIVKTVKEFYQVNEGDSVIMDCIVSSDKEASLEFMWMFGQNDISQDPRYRIENRNEYSPNPHEVRSISRLEIKNVSKDHDGNYVCAVDTINKFISESKELKLTLRVQYKPRFDEKTPKFIWVSEEAVQQGGPLSVNISCIVYADPVASINWFSFDNRPIDSNRPTGGVRTKIIDSINMSTLMLTFRNIDEIRNPRLNSRIKYKCRAENDQGVDSRTFEIKIGHIPDSPMVIGLDYRDGAIILELNETVVEPPIDIYRLEISDEQAHLFNKSHFKNNATYVIETSLPRGEHKVNIYAHNPVGWSEQPYSSYFLQVVSAAYRNDTNRIVNALLLVLVIIALSSGHIKERLIDF